MFNMTVKHMILTLTLSLFSTQLEFGAHVVDVPLNRVDDSFKTVEMSQSFFRHRLVLHQDGGDLTAFLGLKDLKCFCLRWGSAGKRQRMQFNT